MNIKRRAAAITFDRDMEREVVALVQEAVAEEREAIDAVCRTLMIQSADDQATVRAVASAIDKIRVVIRDRAKS